MGEMALVWETVGKAGFAREEQGLGHAASKERVFCGSNLDPLMMHVRDSGSHSKTVEVGNFIELVRVLLT